MDLEDVDLRAGENGEGEIRIIGKGKTDKETLTIESHPARAALAEWIAARGPVAGPLFIRLDRGADSERLEWMTGDSVNRVVRRLSHRAGLKREARAPRSVSKPPADVPQPAGLLHEQRDTIQATNKRLHVAQDSQDVAGGHAGHPTGAHQGYGDRRHDEDLGQAEVKGLGVGEKNPPSCHLRVVLPNRV